MTFGRQPSKYATQEREKAPQGRNREELQAQRCVV